MMKKLFAIAFVLLAGCAGCLHEPKTKQMKPEYYDNTTNAVMQTDFNEEQYIWENFEFSTNRIDRL